MPNDHNHPVALGYRMPAEWNAMPPPGFPAAPERNRFPDSYDRVVCRPAMAAALLEPESVNNVCNGAHGAEAQAALEGLERSSPSRDSTNAVP
jgi:hypothetical protein